MKFIQTNQLSAATTIDQMKQKFAYSFDHSSRMKAFFQLNQIANIQQIAKSQTTLQIRN